MVDCVKEMVVMVYKQTMSVSSSLKNAKTHVAMSTEFKVFRKRAADILVLFEYKYKVMSFKRLRTYLRGIMNTNGTYTPIQGAVDDILCREYPRDVDSIIVDGVEIRLVLVWYDRVCDYEAKCTYHASTEHKGFYSWDSGEHQPIMPRASKDIAIDLDDMVLVRDLACDIEGWIVRFRKLVDDYEPSAHVWHGGEYKCRLMKGLQCLMRKTAPFKM